MRSKLKHKGECVKYFIVFQAERERERERECVCVVVTLLFHVECDRYACLLRINDVWPYVFACLLHCRTALGLE